MPISKQQLRADRRHALDAWLVSENMQMDEAVFWTAGQTTAEQAKFAELDSEYEVAKDALAAQLGALTSDDLAAWFESISWEATGDTHEERIDEYLAHA